MSELTLEEHVTGLFVIALYWWWTDEQVRSSIAMSSALAVMEYGRNVLA